MGYGYGRGNRATEAPAWRGVDGHGDAQVTRRIVEEPGLPAGAPRSRDGQSEIQSSGRQRCHGVS
jgi:hypothetical protein